MARMAKEGVGNAFTKPLWKRWFPLLICSQPMGPWTPLCFWKVLLRWTLSLDLSAPHEVSLWPRDVLSGWLWCVVKTQLAEHFQDKQRRQFTIWFYESHLHFAEFFKQQALKMHILSMVPRRIAHTFPVSSQRMVSHTCYEELEIYS